ncbi:hypothetical protein MMC19_003828 [Ptychographa xylographoides]|nr:hypothetical protein [Ptychographa xylographoides]
MPSSVPSPPPLKRRRISSPAERPLTLAPSLPSRHITALQPDQIRIFSWNVNGISPFLQREITSFFTSSKNRLPLDNEVKQSTVSLRACLKRWKWPQVVCLQEVKIARGDTVTQQAVKQAIKAPRHTSSTDSPEPGYSAHFSLPRDKFNARGFRGRVYGVCTLVRDDLMPSEQIVPEDRCVKEVSWDLEGRVIVLEDLRRRLAIFNVYAVNGTDNPYRDTQTGDVVGTRHDRKRAFHSGLKRECEEYAGRGWGVVVAGDLNVARSPLDGFPGQRMGEAHVRNRKDFEEKFMAAKDDGGLEMADTFRALHNEERKYTYRGRTSDWGASCDRVDLILLSESAFEKGRVALIEADILDEASERGPSDHVPLYVTIEAKSINRIGPP